MIFSKIFKAKWQSKNAVTRIQAISDELDAERSEDREILHQLLNHDSDELVRRAVLIKLASFEQWLHASSQHANAKTREFAKKQLMLMLTDQHELSLSLAQKQHYLQQCASNSELEAWLQHEQQPELVIALYDKINKPQLLLPLFGQKPLPQVQQHLLAQVEEVALLEKLLKKAANEQIRSSIADKIAALKQAAERPIILAQQVQLLLSKLLALREQSDYQLVLEKQGQLEQQWQQALLEFSCLPDEEQMLFQQKYQDIRAQLDKVFALKAEQFQQQQIALQLAQQRRAVSAEVEQALAELARQLSTCVFESQALHEQDFLAELTRLSGIIAQSPLAEPEQQAYAGKVASMRQQLQRLPEIAESVTEATHMISRISQLALPGSLEQLNDRLPTFEQWQQQWHQVSKRAGDALPDSIVNAYLEIAQAWQQGLKPLQQQQQQLFHRTQKKLHDIKRLLNSGKFNACFAIHKKVLANFPLLSGAQQHKLQHDYDLVNEKLNELSDWEHYVATPKKQQLLDEIQQLIERPLDNPNEQAQQVKQARKRWNSFGHAEHDEALNKAFNDACEQAFAPCRVFYAEQEKIRAQHLQQRQDILQRARDFVAGLSSADADWKAVDATLNKLQQQWRNAGEVDRGQYQKINQQFVSALAPAKDALHEFHQQNVEAKQALIEQATQCQQQQDVNAAIATIKTLQHQWRDIGYAGARYENKLWQTFRAINDQVFAQRQAQQQQANAEQQQAEQQFAGQLAELTAEIADAQDNAALTSLRHRVEALLQQQSHDWPALKATHKSLQDLLSELKQRLTTMKKRQQQANWQALFNVLTRICQHMTDEQLAEDGDYGKLPTSWQKKLQDVLSLQQQADRYQATIELEVLAGKDSPDTDQQQRMAVQVALMQEKMNAGIELDLEQRFHDWLSQGKLTEDDLPLLARLQQIFCS